QVTFRPGAVVCDRERIHVNAACYRDLPKIQGLPRRFGTVSPSFPLTFPLGSANSTLCPACSSRFGLGFAVGGTSTSFLREGEAPAEPSGGRGSCRAFGRARLLPSLREGEAPAEPSGGRGSCRAFESRSPPRPRPPPATRTP